MFSLFPKKKSVDDILEDNGLSPLPYTNVVTFTVDGKVYTAEEFIKHYKDLYTENEDNKALLKSIEEDGTEEHNAAVKLRQENAQLKIDLENWKKGVIAWRTQYDQEVAKNTKLEDEIIEYKKGNKNWVNLYQEVVDKNNELLKEVNGLRHLKKENVELFERVNEVDSAVNERYRAEIFTLKNDIAVLKNRNTELLEKYNGFVTMGGLKYMEAKLQIVQNNYKKCAEERDEYKHQLNAAEKEIEILKRWKKEQLTVQSWWDKVDSYVRDHDDAPLGGIVANTCLNFLKERDELKKRIDGLSLTIDRKNFEVDDLKAEIKRLKEDIVNYVIEKDDKLNEAKETIDTLKSMKTQGFEDYDPSDFEIQKHPMYPIHWGGGDEEKTNQAKQRELYGVEEPWQCPCNKCKDKRENKSEKSWEEAASDLALRVAKLEEQLKYTQKINFKE